MNSNLNNNISKDAKPKKTRKSKSLLSMDVAITSTDDKTDPERMKLQANYLLLRGVLSDPIRLLFFRDWCRSEFCAEHLDFWLAVEEYKVLT
jgi:hypothetical protein